MKDYLKFQSLNSNYIYSFTKIQTASKSYELYISYAFYMHAAEIDLTAFPLDHMK